MEWKTELKKARRACIITIINNTSRTFYLSNQKIPHGKWSAGTTEGPIDALASSPKPLEPSPSQKTEKLEPSASNDKKTMLNNKETSREVIFMMKLVIFLGSE